MTLREYRLAQQGIFKAKFADFQTNAALHGVKVPNMTRPAKIPILSDSEIRQRVDEIMGG